MYGSKLKTAYTARDKIDNLGNKVIMPKDKIPPFIKLWSEIKEMGGSYRSDEVTRGFSRNIVEGLLSKNFLTTDSARKLLAYHKKLKVKHNAPQHEKRKSCIR